MNAQEMGAALAEFFPESAIGWKPQTISKQGDKALAVAYIDARDVMRRLDAVCSIGGWKDEYEFLPSGSIVCRLSIKVDGEWVAKMDVGGLSQQPDDGDKHKAGVSDALKRAAIKFGIGRYLYDLPMQWCDIDQYKKFKQTPRLPAWAIPKTKGQPATSAPPAQPAQAATQPATPPANGQSEPHSPLDFIKRLQAFDQRMSTNVPPLCAKGDCIRHIEAAAAMDNWPANMQEWTPAMIKIAMDVAIKFEKERRAAVAAAAKKDELPLQDNGSTMP